PFRSADSLRRLCRLLGRGCHLTRGHRDSVAREELFGLVFVKVHGEMIDRRGMELGPGVPAQKSRILEEFATRKKGTSDSHRCIRRNKVHLALPRAPIVLTSARVWLLYWLNPAAARPPRIWRGACSR